ncbi:syntaxin-binding protein 4 isoform X8 [Phyllostomus hastatus]|uniref:syntaxin-binding protein 4 isoform X8 n=1 Tax=Phyllostomus hastatus TaxID=9423 RepID=UPI001E68482F|nr:syntaxin-binding protein 4 isoform X8 [Phyllostomus hastatus]
MQDCCGETMNKNTSATVPSGLLENVQENLFPPSLVIRVCCRSSTVMSIQDPAFQMITVTKETGLGLKILGGINRNEGPFVYIQEIIPGGDCCKDGRLKPGDQLVSINKESMIGVSFEEAKSIITRAKLRSESAWEIAFIRQHSDSSGPENPSGTFLLPTSGECGPQASTFSLLSSSPEIPIPNTTSTPKTTDAILPSFQVNQLKTGYKKTEQTPITSLDPSSTDIPNTDTTSARTGHHGPHGKKISLNPSIRLKAEKLEMALNYLGIQPTEEQHQALRQQVRADPKGTVSFGDFVQVARKLFRLQLDEAHVGAPEMSTILDSQLIACGSLEADEMERLKRERNDALKEVNTLKEKLFESERQRKQLTEELHSVKQENVQELRKRITVLDCQLRKSEMARKSFEASTEKLLHFVEAIQEVFSDNSAPLTTLSERRALCASQASLTPLGRPGLGRSRAATLALESRELVRSVRTTLDTDCLPYGWEEAYTADGIKYFINHVTQTTSWIHPVMSALNLSCSEENEEDCSRELPDQKS